MLDCSEAFRTDLLSKLIAKLPHDQIESILNAVDSTLSRYDVSRKQVDIIPANGIPEAVKYFIASKAVENLSNGTLRIYKLRLVDFFTAVKKPVQDVTANDIRLYLYAYRDEKKASNTYLDNIRRILNSFFSWLVTNDYIIKNPCAKVEKIKHQEPQREPLTSYELECLRWDCKTIKEKALVDFLFSTGIRVSELCDMDKSDIDFSNRSAVVRHGKGDKRRIVYFNAESELTLRKYIESRTDDNPALLVNDHRPHNRISVRAVELTLKKTSARGNVHVYPHKLRHTFATSGLRGGMPIEKLQALMGHAEPRTTLIYAKLDMVDLQREHARIYA